MKNLIKSVLIVIAVLMSTTTGAVEVIYAQVGETVTLKPTGGVDWSTQYLYWDVGDVNIAWRNSMGGTGFHNVGKWENMLSMSGNSLVIKNIKQEHFGTYVYKKGVNRDTILASVTFKILKLNVSVNPPSPLLPGDSLSLMCDVESTQGLRRPEIHWLSPSGEKMRNNKRVEVTEQSNGEWTCIVTNDRKETKAKIPVTVVDLAPAPSHPQYTSEFQPLTIPCSIPPHISWEQIKAKGVEGVYWDFLPNPGSVLHSGDSQRLFSLSLEDKLTWKKGQDRGLTPADPQKGTLSLNRQRGREEDTGDYVCTMKFKNGVRLNRTVHVNVLQITSSPGTDLISGQQLNLSCSLGQPLPSGLRLKWFPSEQSSLRSLTSDHHSTHFTIPEVGTGDSGKWKCELWRNSTRLTFAAITLKIEPRLSVWMLVIICSITVIVVLLLIVVFILCRRRQRKMRHLRHRLCQCKNPKPKGFYRT